MKKIYSLLFVVAALFVSTNMNAAGLPVNVGDQVYDKTNARFAECVGITEISSTNVEIHLMIIGLDQFNKKDTLSQAAIDAWNGVTTLTLEAPSTITMSGKKIKTLYDGVKNGAYTGHSRLKTIIVEDAPGYTFTIQGNAFKNCTALTSITFGKSRKLELLSSCFLGCTKLSSVTFPSEAPQDGINLYASCFEGCTSLDLCKVNLNGVKQIWSHAFKNTATGSNVNSTFLALNTVTKLGADILQGTQGSHLIYLQFEPDNEALATTSSNASEAPFYSLRNQIEYIDLTGGTATELGDYLFWGMENADIDWCSGIKKYGKYCLTDCKTIENLYLSDMTSAGESAFAGINAKSVYLPVDVPTLGTNAFGAMVAGDASTLFIIDSNTCDEEIIELYVEENDGMLMEAFFEGRLDMKGPRNTPSVYYTRIENAVAVPLETGYTSGSSAGSCIRRPLCSTPSALFQISKSTAFHVTNATGDTIQNFPLAYFEYAGEKYYPDANKQILVPLADDPNEKITAVYSPIILTEVELNVKMPAAGDPSDGSKLEITLPDGALYEVVEPTGIFMADGAHIEEETLQAGEEYVVGIYVAPKDLGRYAFPWGETAHKIDASRINISFNGAAPDGTLSFADDAFLIIKNFTAAEAPEGVENIGDGQKANKILRDGQLIIIRDGKEFNAQGTQL